MGVHLRPGHKIEEGKKGWTEISYEDIVDDIRLGVMDLGYWGDKVSDNILDAHSPIYSIPNPWASAFLFNYVLNDNTHPLAGPLILQILNLISDFAISNKISLIKLDKPENSSTFNKLWVMAPDFIKYNDAMWFFKEKNTGMIVGGLSKNSLLWTAQQYYGKRTEEELTNDTKLIYYLQKVKEDHQPADQDQERFNTFWSHSLLSEMINKPSQEFTQIPVEESPEKWLRIIEWFDFKSSFESGWIKYEKLGYFDEKYVSGLSEKFLYPVKPVFLNTIRSLDDLHIDGKIREAGNNVGASLKFRGEQNIDLIQNYFEERRSIAVWPPFQSEYTPNFVIEFFSGDIDKNVKSIGDLERLEFYNKEGKKIAIETTKSFNDLQLRIYKLSNNEFPYYIRILRRDRGKIVGGFVRIKPSIEKGDSNDDIVIGIDFGTSHTGINFRKGNTKQIVNLNFTKSKPIIVTDKQSIYGLLYNFLPRGFIENKPTTKEEWERHDPWQPFQSIWMSFLDGDRGSGNLELFQDGIIPFLYYTDLTTHQGIKVNLKWGSEKETEQYRKLFLKQIILMITVEMETIGFKNLKIRWSYPKAFSTEQYLNVASFWNENVKLGNMNKVVIDKKGYTEAQASALYFLEEEDNFNTAGQVAIIDVGGGTTDISFWKERKLEWEDSVKFGGIDFLEVASDLRNFVGADSTSSYDVAIRKWPYIHPNWDGEMSDLSNKGYYNKISRTLGLFFCGLSYYIGLHLRKSQIKEPLSEIALAGNGIRFFELFTFGNSLTEENLSEWYSLFRQCIAAGHNINGDYSTSIIFSPRPKQEVSTGLVSNILKEYQVKNDSSQKMFGIDFILDGKQFEYSDWSDKGATEFVTAQFNVSIFIDFISHFKHYAKKNFNRWKLDELPDNVDENMINIFRNSLERRGKEELASSLFFELLKAYMKSQY